MPVEKILLYRIEIKGLFSKLYSEIMGFLEKGKLVLLNQWVVMLGQEINEAE